MGGGTVYSVSRFILGTLQSSSNSSRETAYLGMFFLVRTLRIIATLSGVALVDRPKHTLKSGN